MKKLKAVQVLVFGYSCVFISGSQALDTLPQGAGIAWRYVRDSGITADTAVVFADDFETYAQPSDLWKTYYNVFQINQIRIAQEAGHVYSGNKALEFTLPQQSAELSNGVQIALARNAKHYTATLGPYYNFRFHPKRDRIRLRGAQSRQRRGARGAME